MKKSIIIAIIFIATSFVSFASTTGKAASEYNNYTIEQIDFSNYAIDYDSSLGNNISVEIKKEGKTTHYLIHSTEFEVMYVSNKSGLGLRTMPKKWRTISDNSKLKFEAFQQQAKLTTKGVNNAETLQIIADFLPDVLK